MKTLLISCCIICSSMYATAQSPDTTKIGQDTIRSAWSQRPGTAGNQPLSNTPTPPPLTNPVDNPTSGQTNPPQQAPPADMPPPLQKPDTMQKRKP